MARASPWPDTDRHGRGRSGAQWDGPVQTIRPGDVVSIPPGVKHWHGAVATKTMTHIAVTETLDGKSVEWFEQVSADQYKAAKSAD